MASSFIRPPKSDQCTSKEESTKGKGFGAKSSDTQDKRSTRMPNKNRVINKLALVLISIVVLELVLIGDQVQPVKAIKKKIYLKKLKKLLPLFALVKPKKKIILVPIPIPMFKSHSSYQYQQHPQQQHHGLRPTIVPHQASYGPMAGPMSFMMLDNERPGPPSPGYMSLPMEGVAQMSLSGDTESFITEPTTSTSGGTNAMAANGSASSDNPMGVMGPSMTMVIHSKPDGGSNIELSTNINGSPPSSESAALMQRPHGGGAGSTKWRPTSPAKQIRQHQQPAQLMQQLQLHLNHHQQQQQPNIDHFDEPSAMATALEQPGGEQYYSSPWANRSPIASSAKMLRLPQGRPTQSWPTLRPQPQLQPGHWRPSNSIEPARYQQQQLIDQQLHQALEMEELMPVGPPQLMPAYRSPSGQLHVPLPPMRGPPSMVVQIEQQHEALRVPGNGLTGPDEQGEEVQTLGRPDQSRPEPYGPSGRLQQQQPRPNKTNTSGQSPPTSGRLVSPAIKGKQQQQQQQQQQTQPSTKHKPLSGGY